MPALEMKVPPLAVLVAALALAWFVSGRPETFLWTNVLVGGVIAAIGAVVATIAFAQFIAAGTSSDPRATTVSQRLVTTGIFARSRNPMYLGFALVLTGWILALGSLWGGIVLPAFVDYLTRFQIEPEERLMRKTFGAAYDTYVSRVRRWI